MITLLAASGVVAIVILLFIVVAWRVIVNDWFADLLSNAIEDFRAAMEAERRNG